MGLPFGAYAPPAFSPSDVAGLTLWLDASQITGVADGGTLATWPDMSGNGYNATQATVADQPTYYKSTAGKTVNGLPAVWYPASTEFMQTGAFVSALTVGTIFLVGRAPYPSAATINLCSGISSGSVWAIFTYGSTSPWSLWEGASVLASGTVNDGAMHQLTGLFAGTASTALRLDGAQIVSGTAGSGSLTGFTIGADWNGAADVTPDFMAEALVYNAVLSAADVASVESYLHQKWATP